MRSILAGVFVVAASSSAFAEEELVVAEPAPGPIEIGIYSGAFIASDYHQYYELGKFPGAEGEPNYRPELRRFCPLAGLRFAYFFLPWLGVETDINAVFAETKAQPTKEAAKIYSGRLQLMFQASSLSQYFVPYVSIGDGVGRLSSEYLGADTDYPPFVGAGFRLFFHRSIALRVDGRWMRAPTPQAPFTLNTNLGELMFGLSFRPSRAPAEPPPPPPPPPPKDSDGDTLFDDKDKCPNEPEDLDQFDDTDGCPELDNDGDLISDPNDKCPLEAEDKDGVQDDDGCIDKDNDGDTIADTQDKCPGEPEDVDGFQDTDGCPELDNDSDSFADAADKCPNEAEVINGTDDEDGCPDRGNALVVVAPDRLEALESIEFKKTTLQKTSFNLLGQIGATLRAHPEILRIRITVHVQPSKKPDDDQRLSELRAFAIREWLIKYGIDEKRMDPRGFGGTKPLVDPKSKGAKTINERVDLIILERK
ncbi:MAG TPA: OmpA family protein [Kofleriaceae bacterium]